MKNIHICVLNSHFLLSNKLQKDVALDSLGKTAEPNACIHISVKIARKDVIVAKTSVMFLRDVLLTQQVNNKSNACLNR